MSAPLIIVLPPQPVAPTLTPPPPPPPSPLPPPASLLPLPPGPPWQASSSSATELTGNVTRWAFMFAPRLTAVSVTLPPCRGEGNTISRRAPARFALRELEQIVDVRAHRGVEAVETRLGRFDQVVTSGLGAARSQ